MTENLQNETLGMKRVCLAFNPSGNVQVNQIKVAVAELIDFCEKYKHRDPRLCALAQTTFEEAAMWAVKLVTRTPPQDEQKELPQSPQGN